MHAAWLLSAYCQQRVTVAQLAQNCVPHLHRSERTNLNMTTCVALAAASVLLGVIAQLMRPSSSAAYNNGTKHSGYATVQRRSTWNCSICCSVWMEVLTRVAYLQVSWQVPMFCQQQSNVLLLQGQPVMPQLTLQRGVNSTYLIATLHFSESDIQEYRYSSLFCYLLRPRCPCTSKMIDNSAQGCGCIYVASAD